MTDVLQLKTEAVTILRTQCPVVDFFQIQIKSRHVNYQNAMPKSGFFQLQIRSRHDIRTQCQLTDIVQLKTEAVTIFRTQCQMEAVTIERSAK